MSKETRKKLDELKARFERERGGKWTYDLLVKELLKAFGEKGKEGGAEIKPEEVVGMLPRIFSACD